MRATLGELEDRIGLDPETRAVIERVVGGHRTLGDVARWGTAQDPPRLVVDVVVQDEYTHDVVVPWDGAIHLVYDTT